MNSFTPLSSRYLTTLLLQSSIFQVFVHKSLYHSKLFEFDHRDFLRRALHFVAVLLRQLSVLALSLLLILA